MLRIGATRSLVELYATSILRSLLSARCNYSSHGENVVLSFGDGTQGALGLPDSVVGHAACGYEPTLIPALPSDIAGISAGHYHSLAFSCSGELWSWGRDQEAQLGRGTMSTRDTWNEPKRVQGLDDVKVVAAFASGVVSAAIGSDGSLWTWGRSKRGQLGLDSGVTDALLPSKVDALAGEKVRKAAFGWGHVLALTEDGKLFGWGYSADGRIGKLGGTVVSPLDSVSFTSCSDMNIAERVVVDDIEKEENLPIVWQPCLIEELKGKTVIDVACGLDHSLVLCGDGTLYSSGSNVYGQLGRKVDGLGFFPVDIQANCILAIASGLGHSLAIAQRSSSEVKWDPVSLFTWGWNQRSQLGRRGLEHAALEVECLNGENIVIAAGGRVHSIAVTSKGEAWVWGCGKSGRLGLGSSADEPEPILIECLEGCQVLQAATGFDHTLLLVAK